MERALCVNLISISELKMEVSYGVVKCPYKCLSCYSIFYTG